MLADFRPDLTLAAELASIDDADGDDGAYPTLLTGRVPRSWLEPRRASTAVLGGEFVDVRAAITLATLCLRHADLAAAMGLTCAAYLRRLRFTTFLADAATSAKCGPVPSSGSSSRRHSNRKNVARSTLKSPYLRRHRMAAPVMPHALATSPTWTQRSRTTETRPPRKPFSPRTSLVSSQLAALVGRTTQGLDQQLHEAPCVCGERDVTVGRGVGLRTGVDHRSTHR